MGSHAQHAAHRDLHQSLGRRASWPMIFTVSICFSLLSDGLRSFAGYQELDMARRTFPSRRSRRKARNPVACQGLVKHFPVAGGCFGKRARSLRAVDDDVRSPVARARPSASSARRLRQVHDRAPPDASFSVRFRRNLYDGMLVPAACCSRNSGAPCRWCSQDGYALAQSTPDGGGIHHLRPQGLGRVSDRAAARTIARPPWPGSACVRMSLRRAILTRYPAGSGASTSPALALSPRLVILG